MLDEPTILIATPLYPPDIGGPATYTALVENELGRRGYQVRVVKFSSVHHLPKIIRHLAYVAKIIKKSFGADIIYAQDPVSVGLPALLAATILWKKFMVRLPGDYAWEQSTQRFGVKDSIDDFQNKHYGWRTEFLRFVQSLVVKRAMAVVTPSEYFKKLVTGWGSKPAKVCAIYNGLKLPDLPNATLDWDSRERVILTAGRLVPWKGFSGLINLMKDLPDWRLVIAGDGPERQKLAEQIVELKLTDRVTLAGSLPQEQLLEWLLKAKVFVLNTSFESFSFQIVEAMNAGIPVIATKIGSIPELITDGTEGVLVNPDDLMAIKNGVEKIAADSFWRQNIIAAAKQKAQKFSVEATINKLETLWQK